MTIAIVGAGITGLMAAYELVKRGQRPIVIEPAAPGGMIRSRSFAGFTLEQGPNVLVERPDIASLIDELGLRERVRYPVVEPYGQYVWFRGSPSKVPAGGLELLRSPLFSLQTKLTLPYRLLKKGILKPRSDDLSVLDFFSPLIGAGAANSLLDPVLKGIYGGDVNSLSARTIFPGLWQAGLQGDSVVGYLRKRPQRGKPRIFVLDGGIQSLSDRLLKAIEGRVQFVSARVESIHPHGKGFKVFCDGRAPLDVAGCVVTTAGAQTSSLIHHMHPELSASLVGMRFASLSVVHCAVDRTQSLIQDAFGVLFPGGMPENLLGVMFNSLIFPHVAPPSKQLLTVVLGGAQAGDVVPSEERLRERVPELLVQFLGVPGAEWLGWCEWRRAIPQLRVGHYRIVQELDDAERRSRGVVFCGVDRGGVGVSDRLRVAREAVARISSEPISKVA